MSRQSPSAQLSLFEPADVPSRSSPVAPAPVDPAQRELAGELPAGTFLGTSSWSFPGWAGIVWAKEYSQRLLARQGLAAYARHPLLGAAGIDRTYYQPLPADEIGVYTGQVPAGFRFVVKAHEAVTLSAYPERERYGAKAGERNPLFLDAAYATEEVVGPTVEGLGETAGPLVFQFAPQELGRPLDFVERLFRFLDALPKGPLYAVEIRNREILGPQYALALADAGASPCLTVHPRMPDLATQWEATARHALAPEAALVLRWMLRPGQTYDGARERYTPFNRLVDEDPGNRATVARLIREATAAGRAAFVTANNKAEGSAPLTLFALAREIVEGA